MGMCICSSLIWGFYAMCSLRILLNLIKTIFDFIVHLHSAKNNIINKTRYISKYSKLLFFRKPTNGFKSKKSKQFIPKEIKTFLKHASNSKIFTTVIQLNIVFCKILELYYFKDVLIFIFAELDDATNWKIWQYMI